MQPQNITTNKDSMNKNRKQYYYYCLWVIGFPLLMSSILHCVLSLRRIGPGSELLFCAIPYLVCIYVYLAIEKSPFHWVQSWVMKHKDEFEEMLGNSIKIGIGLAFVFFFLMEAMLNCFGYEKVDIRRSGRGDSYYYVKSSSPQDSKR
ncbi:hypothetical protein SAMN05216233_105237 [Desulfoluna spongiiphila]|uniref:Uncharacterized protein n=2 Tax=Desulfoluna spongiiphila TaxID=419481 RepID=A0A1G5E8I7_9BACT|nr:hypothetical protein SAMN05216233_105237 [Desulfoluna spongiiphila]